MILSRSPLRISLGGGGTDLPSYYSKFGGYTLSAAIDKYVYVSVGKPFSAGIKAKYSKYEEVYSLTNLEHPIIREAIRHFSPNENQLEITTFADVPAGTGLGSSGSFTTGILLALSSFFGKPLSKEQLANLACKIEIEVLEQSIGKQDQYISTFGGITEFFYHEDGAVTHKSLDMSLENLVKLNGSLLLYFTGISRSANVILKEQDLASFSRESEMNLQLHATDQEKQYQMLMGKTLC
jgi:D-glycero-alpha-D-manno-heptose-7-phosphate kinase